VTSGTELGKERLILGGCILNIRRSKAPNMRSDTHRGTAHRGRCSEVVQAQDERHDRSYAPAHAPTQHALGTGTGGDGNAKERVLKPPQQRWQASYSPACIAHRGMLHARRASMLARPQSRMRPLQHVGEAANRRCTVQRPPPLPLVVLRAVLVVVDVLLQLQ
jgi:hypothetical protein